MTIQSQERLFNRSPNIAPSNLLYPTEGGKISSQPHTIVKNSVFPMAMYFFLSLFSQSKNWMHNVVWCCAEILPWKPTTKRRSFNWPHGEEWRRVQGLLEPVDECSDTKVIQRLNVQYINKYERINTRSGRPPSRACALVRSIRMKFLYIPQARRKIWRTTKRTSLRKVLQQRNTYQIHSS